MGKESDLKELKILREVRKGRQLRWVGGILMTEKTREEYRTTYCAGCGRTKKRPKMYFGEEFCGDCVESWKVRR